jgi:hypothetical protein
MDNATGLDVESVVGCEYIEAVEDNADIGV